MKHTNCAMHSNMLTSLLRNVGFSIRINVYYMETGPNTPTFFLVFTSLPHMLIINITNYRIGVAEPVATLLVFAIGIGESSGIAYGANNTIAIFGFYVGRCMEWK